MHYYLGGRSFSAVKDAIGDVGLYQKENASIRTASHSKESWGKCYTCFRLVGLHFGSKHY